MPLKGKAKKVMESMKDTYKSDKKAKEVFYSTANKENRVPETWEKKGSASPVDQLYRLLKSRS